MRLNLVESTGIQKYLLYAVGEIALVVIGILLALQINNWNESRKEQKVEVDLLKGLRQSILDGYDLLNNSIEGNKRAMRSGEIILGAIEDDLPYHDSLAIHFEQSNIWWAINLRTDAYDNVKSHGMEFIKDDTSRVALAFLYDTQLNFAKRLEERQSLYHYNTVTPVLNELFESIDHHWFIATKGNIPYDFETLKQNMKYKSILRTNISNRDNYNGWILFMLNTMENLDIRILEEINTLEDNQ